MIVLDEAKMRLLTGNNNLACGPIPKPDATNPLIVKDMKGFDLLKLQEYQKTLWQEYDLWEAVDAYTVTSIKQVVNAQYTEDKRKEYVGYNDKTIHLLLSHFQTWDIINNKDKIEAKARVHHPWSDSPDQHITSFA